MRKYIKFVFLCLVLTSITLVRLYETHYDSSIADAIAVLLGAVIATGLFIKGFFTAIKKTADDNVQHLLPIGIWISCVAVVTTYNLWLNRLESVPNFLCVTDGNNLGFDEFSLKKDGRYVYESANLLGSSYNYGTYTRHDSIISLLPSSVLNAPKQLTLLIRPYNKFSTPAYTLHSRVYAINQNGKPRHFDSGYEGFRIVELATK